MPFEHIPFFLSELVFVVFFTADVGVIYNGVVGLVVVYVSFNPKLVYALILLYKFMIVNNYLVIRNIDIAYTFH